MITIEQIDEFRKRTNSSYGDAKYFLERNNGNVLDAIIDFERTKAGKTHSQNKQNSDVGKRFAEVLQKGFDTKMIVEDKNSILFSVPVILLIILIPLWPVVILFFTFLAILGYKFKIQEVKSKSFDVDSFFKNINVKMKECNEQRGCNHQQKTKDSGSSSNTQKNQNTQKSQNTQNTANTTAVTCTTVEGRNNQNSNNQDVNDDDDDDYNEFTIE